MNRIIKFRIWGTTANRWISFYSRNVIENGILELDFCDDWVAQQFTGLRDSAGIEIYEGDILTYYQWLEEDDPHYCQVKFGNGSFDGVCYMYVGFYLENKDGEKMEPWEITSLVNGDENYKFSVIGNIFETPELLK